jgi:DNA polymerase-3 subunit chi
LNPNIVFIVLSSAVKEKIVCDLAEKCFLSHKRVVILVKDENEAQQIDKLLWMWKQQSFVPHRYSESLDESFAESVVITTQVNKNPDFDILLTLHPVDWDILVKFGMVIDFAEKYDSHALQESRNRFRNFKEKGVSVSSMQPGEFLHSTLI